MDAVNGDFKKVGSLPKTDVLGTDVSSVGASMVSTLKLPVDR